MLYIKFTIQDQQKYQDFQKVYDHMVMVRQPDFEFEEEEDDEFDWNNSSQEEINKYLDESEPEVKRYKRLFPEYANTVLESYVKYDESIAGVYGFDIKGIFNYLEFSFEVDMDNLRTLKDTIGLVEFSTGNYPFGGLERFIMTLKAFDLIPTECYNGFTIYQFKWISEFIYEGIDLPEKTKLYKEKNLD